MLDFDIWTIVFSVINILVLFFFLKKFLFGRVGAMLEKRAQMVQADMDQAKQKAAEAEKLRSDYEETLNGAKQEAKQIIATAEQNAHAQGSEITAKAQQQADTLLKEAQKEIERERRQTLDGVQGEIADLALAAASKLMEQKVGLVADFQITCFGNGVAFPDFVGTGGHELIYCRNADNLTDGFHQFLSILTVISNGHVKNSFLSAFLLSP